MILRSKIVLIFFFVLFYSHIFSQQDSITVEDILNNILDEATIEKEDSQLYDLIEQMLEDPININTATKSEILSIPFMDVESAEIILNYRKTNGKLFSVNEIELIDGLAPNISKTLKYFIKVSSIESGDVKSFVGLYSLKFRSRIIQDVQERTGFTDSIYEGSRTKAYNRVKFQVNPMISMGGLIEKDAGENLYWDFYSAHVQINQMLPQTNIVLGDYTIEFGQGLSMWSPYSFSKSSDATNSIIKRSRNLKPYTSSGEANFLRGGALYSNLYNFSITGFYSVMNLDATLSGSNSFSSIRLDGYHRSENELFRQNTVRDKTYGASLSYNLFDISNIGVLYYEKSFSHIYEPISYENINADHFQFASASYDILFKNVYFIGELSYFQDSFASINTLQISLARNFIITAVYRNYPKDYFSFYSNGFGEKSTTNNETGFYTGLKWRTQIGEFNFYLDQFKFSDAGYSIPLPSNGNELSFSYGNRFSKGLKFYLRYFNENKEKLEVVNQESQIVNQNLQKVRSEITFQINPIIRLRSRVELSFLEQKETAWRETGFLVFQDFQFKFPIHLTIISRIIFFQTDSYSSRIYEFENDLTGVMTNLPLYGTGMRWYLLVRYKAFEFINLSLKYSELYKPNEEYLGTSHSTISGNVDNRISFQADISF